MKVSDIGPGLLLAATGIGVGDMVSSTIAGAEYGLTLVWALAAGVILKFAITEGAARWQLATGSTLIEGWREHLPRAAIWAFFIYFIVWSYFVSSALVAASALVPAAIVPPVPLAVWGVPARGGGVRDGLVRPLRAVSRDRQVVHRPEVRRHHRVGAAHRALVRRRLVGASARVRVLHRLHAVAHRRRGRHGHAAVVRVLDARGRLERPRHVRIRARRPHPVVLAGLHVLHLDDLHRDADRLDRADPGRRSAALSAAGGSHRAGDRARSAVPCSCSASGGPRFRRCSACTTACRFSSTTWIHVWRRQTPKGQQGRAYRAWAAYLALAAMSALVVQRPVLLVFAYTVVGSLFFPFVISTLLWLNNSRHACVTRNGLFVNGVLGAALLLYVYLAYEAVLERLA